MTLLEALNHELCKVSNQRITAEKEVASLKGQEDKLARIKNELAETPPKDDGRKRPMPQAQKDKISAALKARAAARNQ